MWFVSMKQPLALYPPPMVITAVTKKRGKNVMICGTHTSVTLTVRTATIQTPLTSWQMYAMDFHNAAFP
ncbi:hypothetical protein HOLleu_23986 [Holothuria leucospilota]|uniref:Uncharacterized protein n=1 Tax=Holothuria leucospilota TaxID=206669 RepID=A0A9Q1BW08_HOLLE|nr:hypothetical protein HOLleu_23986 [Holothuria leucospilota]